MNRLTREITVQRDEVECAFTSMLDSIKAEVYDQSVSLTNVLLDEHDPFYFILRKRIEVVLKQALFEDCDPTKELMDLCDNL